MARGAVPSYQKGALTARLGARKQTRDGSFGCFRDIRPPGYRNCIAGQNYFGPSIWIKHRINPMTISLIVFGTVFGGAVIGMILRAVLPEHHLAAESRDVVTLGMGLVATMTALVLGPLIASAKSSFDTRRAWRLMFCASERPLRGARSSTRVGFPFPYNSHCTCSRPRARNGSTSTGISHSFSLRVESRLEPRNNGAGAFPARSFLVLASREGGYAQERKIADGRHGGDERSAWLCGRFHEV